MMELESLLLKLSRPLLQNYFNTPYGRQRSIKKKTIESAYKKITQKKDSPKLREAIQLLFLLNYSVEVESISANMSQGHAMPDPEIADQADRMWQENYAPIINTLGKVLNSLTKRPINHDRYPGSQWLDEPREIGTIGHLPLFLAGWEEPGNVEYALVSVDRSGTGSRPWATPLYELLSHSQEPIKITGSLEP